MRNPVGAKSNQCDIKAARELNMRLPANNPAMQRWKRALKAHCTPLLTLLFCGHLFAQAEIQSSTLAAAATLQDPQANSSADELIEAENLDSIQRDALIQRLLTESRGFYQAAYPSAEVDVQIAQMPKAIENRQCNEDPRVVFPRQLNRSGRLLVSIQCAAPRSWKVLVPMNVDVSQQVLVATGPIARGTEIRPSHVITRKINLDSFRDQYVTSFDQISGMIVKRTFRDGQVIRTDQLTEPTLVERGEKIVITAKAGQTYVKMFGTALSSGKLGDQIRVKNISSSRILVAKVTEKGQVSVPM